jgi:hypothetical protein
MKVEILTTFGHKGNQFIETEQRIVSEADGEYFCRAGWAKDLAGVVPTGNPGVNEVVLEVRDVDTVIDVSLAQ